MNEAPEWIKITLAVFSFIVAISNIYLLSVLLRSFICSYRRLKAKFTKGLIFFVSFLLVQQLFFLAGLIALSQFRGPSSGGPIFFLNLLELIALLIFFKTTRE